MVIDGMPLASLTGMGNDNPQCTTQAATDAAKKVVILAFDLADKTLLDSADLLAATLQGPKVREAIQLAMGNYILARIPTTSGEMTEADAQALQKTITGLVTGPVSKQLLENVKKTPEYKSLEGGIKDFLATAGCTPLGVWVDKNKTVLIVSGVVLAVGGVVGLFVTKTGGPVVEFPLGLLKDAKIPMFKLGSLGVNATFGELKPSVQEIGAGILLTQPIKTVSLDLKISATKFFAPAKQVGGSVMTRTSALSIDPSGGAPLNDRISLAFTVRSNNDDFSATLSGILEKNQPPKATLDAKVRVVKGVALGLKGEVAPHDYAVFGTFNLLDF